MRQHVVSAAPPQQHLLGIMVGFWQSRALAIAIELDVAECLAAGPLHVDVLASQTGADASSLFRLMRALESVSVFAQLSPRVFANTPASEYLRKSVPGSQWAILRILLSTGAGQYEAWGALLDSVRSGQIAFNNLYGCSVWEFFKRNPELRAIFDESQRSIASVTTPAVTASYDWGTFPVIADIGGGIGSQLTDILDAYPTCRGILFDQAEAIANWVPHNRVTPVVGDFFVSVPAGADAYILRSVIHDWAPSEATAILHNVRKAMKPSAYLMLIEASIPETPEFHLNKWIDLHMLVAAGGRERTGPEYGELLSQTGFELETIIPTPSPVSIFIGRPRV